MASDCIFYVEDHDMGATIPFCVFDRSNIWNCCRYYELRGSTQELCPHYISKEDVRETLRKSFTEEAGDHRRMTNLEKLVSTLTLDELHHAFCKRNFDPNLGCLNCPLYSPSRPCRRMGKVCDTFSEWLDEEAEE